MQFIPLCLFTILLAYSLVNAAPIEKTENKETAESKQQKATAIAGRLLKQIANEQAVHQKESVSDVEKPKETKDEKTNQQPKQEVQTSAEENDDGDDDSIELQNLEYLLQAIKHEFPSTFDETVEKNLDEHFDDDEENSTDDEDDEDDDELALYDFNLLTELASKNNDEINKLLNELEEEDQEETSTIHSPVMDDSLMNAEEHRRRRSLY